jgi:Zn-dependent M28 family amino/carboxypeptidase
VTARYDAGAVGYNVAGFIEGSDPRLRRECLVVGGHFDHTGFHCGILFPGADDNASGSAVVMETARAFARLGRKPRRSVVFVLFGGEEMGLQGSHYFSEHLPAVFAKADGMFNFDMVGEGDGSAVMFTADAADFKRMLDEADAFVHTLRNTGTIGHVGVRSSDFAPFFLKGVPCMSFFSNGPHLAYHLPGDTIYRINPDILADIARLAFLSGYAWADR